MQRTRSVNSSLVRFDALVAISVSLLLSLAVAFVFHHHTAHRGLFSLANGVGPTVQSLLQGNGLLLVTRGMGTDTPLTYHAARMPLATLVVAAGVRLFGPDGTFPVALMKTVLFLVPLWGAMCLVLYRGYNRQQRWPILLLLLLPFSMLPFLADVVNLQVEEGYCYSLLALAVAMVLVPLPASGERNGLKPLLYAAVLASSLDALFLTKSSMIAAVAVLTVFALWQFRSNAARAVLLLLICAAPIGWALHQQSVSGRLSLGTSLDGANLHKGNNDKFLARYPPRSGDNLDHYDPELNAGIDFKNEWDFNDYHKHAAIQWMKANPALAVQADVRKAIVFFASVHKVGSADVAGTALALVETCGMILFRLLLLASVVCCAAALVTNSWPGRVDALMFFLLLGATAAPYILGFAYTRHASILIYPVVILLCKVIVRPDTSAQHLQ